MTSQFAAILLGFYGTVVGEDDAAIRQICRQVVAASPLSTAAQVGSWWARAFRALCAASPRAGVSSAAGARTPLPAAGTRAGRGQPRRRGPEPAHVRVLDTPGALAREQAGARARPVPICLVSNIDTADLQQALAHVGLSFAAIVTSEDCRAYKPHPAPFERALSLLGLPPSHALHVGDSWGSDMVGAQAAGIPVLSINRRQRPIPDGGSPPTFMAADLTGLLEIVGPS